MGVMSLSEKQHKCKRWLAVHSPSAHKVDDKC